MLVVNGHKIKCLAVKEGPAALPWKQLGVEYVIESTGLFTEAEKAKGHLTAGAKKVIISAPAKGEDITIVMGVNHEKYDHGQAHHHFQRQLHHELPGAGRPRAAQGRLRHRGRVDDDDPQLHGHAEDRGRPVEEGLEGRPRRGDQHHSVHHRGGQGRAALAIPEVKGKLTGMSFRVPTPTVSVVDLTVRTVKETSYKEICAAMKRASETYLKGILAYTGDEIVSSDFIHDAHSSIFDAGSGIELNSRFFKLVSWYDNEWGYSNRCVDLLRYMVGRVQCAKSMPSNGGRRYNGMAACIYVPGSWVIAWT